MEILLTVFLLFLIFRHGTSYCLRRNNRQLQSYYYSTSDASILGSPNIDVAIRNPLKGLLTSPRWTASDVPDFVPSSLEFYYIGLDEVMTGPNQFDWTVTDKTLQDAISRKKHVIWRYFVHYPGQRLRIPQYLLNAGLQLYDTTDTNGKSPNYDDPMLLEAFQQFISALGSRYDGAKGLGFVQLGLFGFWGEWHTYPVTGLLSENAKNKIVQWYDSAFSITPLQTRYPLASAYSAKMGYHDDSFASSTLDGAANAGKVQSWFFWPSVIQKGQTDFWKKAPMGGETRPEIQGQVFEEGYPAGLVENTQDFMLCVETTHATYIIHHDAFKSSSPYSGKELENAQKAHASMGYNFQISQVAVASESSAGTASVDVTVQQVGVAPFYYPLSLVLSCQGFEKVLSGVESIIEKGESKVFSFTGVPADSTCFQSVSLNLQSDYVHQERPVLFAQGNGMVLLTLPLPTGSAIQPTGSPLQPSKSPVPPSSGPTPPIGSTPIPPTGSPNLMTGSPLPPSGSPLPPGGPTSPIGSVPTPLTGSPIQPTVSPLPPTRPSSPAGPPPFPPTGSPPSQWTLSCFSSHNLVEVLGKGFIPMNQLRIGDFVRSRDQQYSRVYSFGHIHHDVEVEFLQIYSSGLESPLEISAIHMIFVDKKAVRADSIQVGDILDQQHVVTMVKSIKRRGIYAPFTEAGDIVVSGILASSYIEILKNAPTMDQHRAAHAFLAIRRIMCRWNFDRCMSESYTDEGLATWLAPFAKVVDRLDRDNACYKLIIIILCKSFAYFFSLLERLLFLCANQQHWLILSLVLFSIRRKTCRFK